MINTYPSYQAAFLDNLEEVRKFAGKVVTVKGTETKELLHRNFIVTQPQERVMIVKYRNDNIFAKIAETMWVLAGRNDMDFLAHYLPRAPQWADNGKEWRAGYGPRLRAWHTTEDENLEAVYRTTDQISKCFQHMQDNHDTRQAVIALWDPAYDWVESKDIPCNNWLHFIIRDNRLHLAVVVRSNDILWGFSGINFFEWSVLHEAMAYWLGVEVGHINWFASSLHLYERHYDRADRILSATYTTDMTVYDFDIPHVAWDTKFHALDSVLSDFFAYEAEIRKDYKLGWPGHIVEGQNAFIHTCLTMLTAYNAYQQGADSADVADIIDTMPMSDFRVAAIEYMMRQFGHDFLSDVSLSTEEAQFLSFYTQ